MNICLLNILAWKDEKSFPEKSQGSGLKLDYHFLLFAVSVKRESEMNLSHQGSCNYPKVFAGHQL